MRTKTTPMLCFLILACVIATALPGCRQPAEDRDRPIKRSIPNPLIQETKSELDDESGAHGARSVKSVDFEAPRGTATMASRNAFSGQTVTFLCLESQIATALVEIEEEFEAETGADLQVVLMPFEDVYLEYVNDALSGAPRFDGLIAGAWWIGGLVEKNLIRDYDVYYGDPRFPAWDIEDVLTAPRRLLSYNGKKYMVPLDHDVQILYYRRDLMQDEGHRAAFRQEYGYPLAVPRTWSEFRDVAAYFHGRDLNGDGEGDYGLSMHLRDGAQGMFHYMSLSAPFVVGPENPELYWLNPENMEPVIDSPGHERALAMMVDLVQYGPREMLGWDLGRSWDLFLQGRAALTFTWGDLAVLAQQEGSKVRGKTGTAMVPGTMEYYSIAKQRWIKTDKPNRAGNTTGGSWAGVISAYSKHPEASYFLLSMMATREKGLFYATRGEDGIDPGRRSQMLAPYGEADIAGFLRLGWSEADVRDFHGAVYESFTSAAQLPYLRIPGTYSYWTILNANLYRAASDQLSPRAALRNTKIDFSAVIEQYGKSELRDSYRRAMEK